MGRLFVVGDIHGQYEKLVGLLKRNSFVNGALNWTGADATLCFTGDFFDRGPDGVSCVDLIMRLQQQASLVGGQVIALLGNHEVLFLAANRFEDHISVSKDLTFLECWAHNGGKATDLARLTDAHIAWLSALPAMARIGDYLLVHSDTTRYSEFGESIQDVNHRVASVLRSDCDFAWWQLLEVLSARSTFVNVRNATVNPVVAFLEQFGGTTLVHGHSPIPVVTHQKAQQVKQPFVYADGLCINVDGGMFMGGNGFIHELSVAPQAKQLEVKYYIEIPTIYMLQIPTFVSR